MQNMWKRGEALIPMENITENKNYSDELADPFEMDFFKEFKKEETPGSNMRFYRKLIGMTQKELASKLDTSVQAVSHMENNLRLISSKTARKLADIFDVSVARFI